jgi:hypothetical protein
LAGLFTFLVWSCSPAKWEAFEIRYQEVDLFRHS